MTRQRCFVDGEVVFIRFVSGDIDEDSHVSAGLFTAAYTLIEESILPDYEYNALNDCLCWFRKHLEDPYRYRLEPAQFVDQSICWFRFGAKEHLTRAWDVVEILERSDIFVRIVKCQRPGYVLYEDRFQIVAYPFADIRALL